MILILSKNTNEVTTEKVIDWLEYYKANYLRLNGDDFYRNVVLREGNFEFTNLDINKVNIV